MDLGGLIPLFFLLKLLAMCISQLLNHPIELHHIHWSTSDLGWKHILFLTILDKVLLNNTHELTHVGVASYHVLEPLHLIEFEQLLFKHVELLDVLAWLLDILLRFLKGYSSLTLLNYRNCIWIFSCGLLRLLWWAMSFELFKCLLSLLLMLILVFLVVTKLLLELLHFQSYLD